MYQLGILGGMGPRATARLFQRLLDFSAAERDQDFANVVILNRCDVPDRSAYLLGEGGENPLPALQEGLAELNRLGVGRILIPCITSHAFLPQLQEGSAAPILNMAELALAHIADRAEPGRRVCILGTLGTVRLGIYERYNHFGLQLCYPPEALCAQVHALVYRVKADRGEEAALRTQLLSMMRQLQALYGSVSFLLACTELSVLNGPELAELDVVDALDILAQRALCDY